MPVFAGHGSPNKHMRQRENLQRRDRSANGSPRGDCAAGDPLPPFPATAADPAGQPSTREGTRV